MTVLCSCFGGDIYIDWGLLASQVCYKLWSWHKSHFILYNFHGQFSHTPNNQKKELLISYLWWLYRYTYIVYIVYLYREIPVIPENCKYFPPSIRVFPAFLPTKLETIWWRKRIWIYIFIIHVYTCDLHCQLNRLYNDLISYCYNVLQSISYR